MKTLFLNGLKVTFDKVVEFEQQDTKLLECFFFKNEVLLTSGFLTLFELNKLKDD
jgi:hypothetical protein